MRGMLPRALILWYTHKHTNGRGTGARPVTHTIPLESIRDLSWMRQLLTGTVYERFRLDGERVVGLKPAKSEGSSYRYRLLFFPPDLDKPFMSINLETSILGSPCYTIEAGRDHRNLGPADFDLTYEEFKIHALEIVADETASTSQSVDSHQSA